MARTLRDDRINKITYISLGGVVAAIILFIILFNIFNSNKKNENLQISENNSVENITEEANSSVGKSVNDAKNENDVQIRLADLLGQENLNKYDYLKQIVYTKKIGHFIINY